MIRHPKTVRASTPKRARTFRTASALAVLAAVLTTGATSPASAQLGSTRKVAYLLTDNAYQPKVPLKLRKGDKLTFTFVNKGKVTHEALVGTIAEQKLHEKEMADMGMTMGDSPDLVVLKPGQTKTISYTFTKAGKYEIGCHQPTHYGLGMKVPITVS